MTSPPPAGPVTGPAGAGPWDRPGPVALGTFEFGAAIPAQLALQLLDVHYELGGRIIDTAPTYGPSPDGYRAETIVARWAAATGVPAAVVTKGGLDPARPDRADLDLDTLMRSARQSADRLGSPLAGFLAHRDDPRIPVGEIADTAHRLIAEGTTLRVGASNWTTERLQQWISYARDHNLSAPQLTSPLWSLAARRTDPITEPWLIEADHAHLALAAAHHLTVLPYRTLAAGYLAPRHSGRHRTHHATAYDTPANRVRRERLHATAARLDLAPEGTALAYLRATGAPAIVIPVTGPTSVRQLRDAMTGATATHLLTPDTLAHLSGAAQ
ncbi:aldo/keto reductase [Streptomyces scopuliridis]|uniref:aldo/keto reductase n=1 Tax=Streptomyces scopuliridis TaxID=452529 RepID=UPI0036BA163A